MEAKLNTYHEAKKPDEGTANGIEIKMKGCIKPCSAETAALNISNAKSSCFRKADKADGQNKIAQHAVPGNNNPAGNKAHAHAKKEQYPDIGGNAKKIVKKTGKIGTECAGVVFYFMGRADRLIKRGVIDIVTPEANPNQKA